MFPSFFPRLYIQVFRIQGQVFNPRQGRIAADSEPHVACSRHSWYIKKIYVDVLEAKAFCSVSMWMEAAAQGLVRDRLELYHRVTYQVLICVRIDRISTVLY